MELFKIDNQYELRFNKATKKWITYEFGEPISSSSEKLFKYYNLNLYNIEAFLNHYFYLSDPGDFNDPFDCNVNLIAGLSATEKVKTVKRNTFNNIGITSFSETVNNHLMWAHYTNNYSGFALEFKGDSIDVNDKNIKRLTLSKIIYPEIPPQILNDFPFAQHYVFTTKFKHWSYEKEWRIVAEVKADERNLQYDTNCIKAIYIGYNIPDNNKSAYRLLLEIQEMRFPEVPVYVVYPHSNDLKLEFEKVWN